MSDVISVVSGKGGTGKTFTAANLAIAFQSLGEQAVCVDMDLDSSNLAMQLGHTPREHTLEDALSRKVNPIKAVSVHDSGLMFVPSSISLSERDPSEEEFQDLIENFSGFADRIVVDSPPGFGRSVRNILNSSDRSIAVTNPEVQAVKDVKKIEKLSGGNTNIEGLVLNKVEGLLEEMSSEQVEKVTGMDVLLKIPHRKGVKRSIHNFEPLASDEYSKIGEKFKELASKLSGRDFEAPKHAPIVRILRKLVRI